MESVRRRFGAAWLAVLVCSGCDTTPSGASMATGPTPTVVSTGSLSVIRVISPGANAVIADRDQPVTLTLALTQAAPTDYTIEVSASPFFTSLAASVRVQLSPQRQASIPLPILTPDSWYIWRIRPTLVEDGTFATMSTFIVGPAAQGVRALRR